MKSLVKRDILAASNAKRKRRREELIKLVNSGISDVGKALMELRDDEHWRDTHNNFSDFCRDNFEISKTYLYDTIKALELIASLPKSVRPKITNERQARALISIPEKERPSVILDCEKNGGITAENILAHSKTNTPKTKPSSPPLADSTLSKKTGSLQPPKPKIKIPEDDMGIPLPDDAIPWGKDSDRGKEVQRVLTEISRLKSIVVGGREKGEYHWLKVTNSITDTFGSLFSLISEAKPYAICTTCMGSPSLQPEGCNFCKNTGLISKWQWDTQSRKEVKDMMIRRATDLKREREAANVH